MRVLRNGGGGRECLWVCFGLAVLFLLGRAPLAGAWDPDSLDPGADGPLDIEGLLESYEGVRVDINLSSRETLRALDIFSGDEIDQVLEGRPWRSVRELTEALRLDAARAELAGAVFFVRRSPSRTGGRLRSRVGWASKVPWPSGPRATSFARWQSRSGLAAALVAEKDPGEGSLVDHRAGYAEGRRQGPFKHWILGDFTLRFGQGILFWPDGPSMLAVSRALRTAEGGRGFSGTSESGFLRGAFCEMAWGPWSVSGFLSDRAVDARVDETGRVTAFPVTGYHRDAQELKEKGRARTRLAGGRLAWGLGSARVGLTACRETTSPEVSLGDPGRDGVRFRGKLRRAASSDWRVLWRRCTWFGELTLERRPSFVVGVSADLGALEAVVWVRKLGRSLYSPYGSLAFVPRAALRNEEGALFGLRVHPWRNLQVSVLADLESRRWRTWNLPMPPRRGEVLFETQVWVRGLSVSLDWKETLSPYLERDETRTIRRALRLRLRPDEPVSFSFDFKEALSKGRRGTLGRGSVTVDFGRVKATGTAVVAWLEPGAPLLSTYAGCLPGEMRFMNASRSGCGCCLVLVGRLCRCSDVSVHQECSRFQSRQRWSAVQLDVRF